VSHALLAQLRSADAADRAAACRAVASDPAGALLAEPVARALGDSDKRVARAASDTLVGLARAGSGDAVVPLLRAVLRGESTLARIHAAITLARLEPPEPSLLPALVLALASPEGDLRWSAARVLVDMGRLHGEIVHVLLGLVRGSEASSVRRMATFCLRELAPDQPAAAQALLEASRDADTQLRRAALTAMAGLLDPPPLVRTRLGEALDDADTVAAGLAALALGELRDVDALPRLRTLAESARTPALQRAAKAAVARLETRR
jgi:HEAT repeat protein